MATMECPDQIVSRRFQLPELDRWIGDGPIALPPYGILASFSALDLRPDPVANHAG